MSLLIILTAAGMANAQTPAATMDMQQLGIGGIFVIMVLNMVFRFMGKYLPNKKTGMEMESKNTSRDKIAETHSRVHDIANHLDSRDDAFYSMRNKVNQMDEIVTATNERRVPLIYNPNLERAVENLANNISIQSNNTKIQTEAIKEMVTEIRNKG